MSDMVIFGIGTFVTALVTISIGLLLWAAATSRDSAHQFEEQRSEGAKFHRPASRAVR